ncbi:MAG: hypothetical protein AB7N29_13465 [Vicinamibacterales bacterium]
MTYLRLVTLEARAIFRTAIPSATLRTALCGTAAIVALLTGALMLWVAVTEGRTPVQGRATVPSLYLMCGLGLSVGIAGASSLQRREAAGSVWRLAPVPGEVAVFVPLLSIVLLTALVTSLAAIPTMLAAASVSVPLLLLAAVIWILGIAWSTSLSVLLVAGIHRIWGARVSERAGSLLPLPVSMSFVFLSPEVARLTPASSAGLVLVVCTALLPWVVHEAADQWVKALASSPIHQEAAPVRWGRPRWLALLAGRTQFPWSMAAVLPLFALAPFPRPEMAVALGTVLPMVAVGHLLRWERETPDRARLAPRGRRYLMTLMATTAGAMLLAHSTVLIALRSDLNRAAALIVLASVAPLGMAIRSGLLRVCVQCLVLAAAIAIIVLTRGD